jgi:M6 family metalloprotease-like protein
MRKILLLFFFTISICYLNAAPFKFLPYTITQPNGEVIECFVSGDEYYNWIHDKDGYTIIQESDGYYYYATDLKEKVVTTSYKVNKVDPKTIGIKAWAKISNADYQKKVQRFDVPLNLKSPGPNHAPHTGTMNNLVIYIRFANESEISTTRKVYDDKLNPTTGVSLRAYFDEVSYSKLAINSTHYPACASPTTTNASYQDSHTRDYFKKYNATTNPNGYKNQTEATAREHQLLADAVNWINTNHPIPSDLNIDADGDQAVDNVCFMIKGAAEGWSDLLWAHRWSLYSRYVYIRGKRVLDYTFQPETQVSVTTLCHEMFHALGAPDLYHYSDNDFSPVGSWDIMEYGRGHMGAYMKYKYAGAKWITSLPEITASGTYSLNPLTSSTNNCFKIASPNSSNEFFVVEYRKQGGYFETNLPGNGLLVYRINTDFDGNANFDNISTFDEVYIYRPNGTVQSNGQIASANFSSDFNRTAINDATTDPKSFLHNGLSGGLDISNITTAGGTISFDVYISSVKKAENFVATGTSETQIDLSWNLNSDNEEVLIVYSTSSLIGSPTRSVDYSVGNIIPGGGTVIYSGKATSFSHTALSSGSNYFYRIWSKSNSTEYSVGVSTKGATYCTMPSIPITHGFNGSEISPCWVVSVVAVGETMEESPSITQVQSGTTPDATPYEGTHMIKFNSTYCGAGNILRLSSPAFSTIGQTNLYVNFAWHRDTQWDSYLDNMTVQWSIDGTNWNNGNTYQRYNPSFIAWTQQAYKLPEAALNQSNLMIAFLFSSEYGYNCYLDNVKIEPNSTVGVEDNNLNNLLIYPNPSKGIFKIKTSQVSSSIRVEVRDVFGKLVLSRIYENSHENTLDLANQPKGLYIITIKTDNNTINQKLVID